MEEVMRLKATFHTFEINCIATMPDKILTMSALSQTVQCLLVLEKSPLFS